MSLILEALKKSQDARLDSSQQGPVAINWQQKLTTPKRLPVVFVLTGGVIAVLSVGLLFKMLIGQPGQPIETAVKINLPATSDVAKMPVIEALEQPSLNMSKPDFPVDLKVLPDELQPVAPVEVVVTRVHKEQKVLSEQIQQPVVEKVKPAKGMDPVRAIKLMPGGEELSPGRQLLEQEIVREAIESQHVVDKSANAHPVTPMGATSGTRSELADGSPVDSGLSEELSAAAVIPAKVVPEIPLLIEMPYAFQKSLPPLVINVHAYSEDPADRYVVLNMRRYRESGKTREGLEVVSIRENSLVLKYDSHQFLLRR